MKESLNHASGKTGLPPGSLVHVGNVLVDQTHMSLLDYSPDSVDEREIGSVEDIIPYIDSDTVTWLIVEGLADVAVVEQVGEVLGVHRLVLEDILNTHQRPKFEEYEQYLFIVLKALMPRGSPFAVAYEQVSLLVFKNLVVVFKEKQDDLLQVVQQRVLTSKGRLRKLGPDFLAYSILDSIIDHNFVLIDALDSAIVATEDELLKVGPSTDTLYSLQKLKREIVHIRRYTSPLRELVGEMLRSESALIDEKTHIYLRDVFDHIIRILESIEIHQDMLAGLMEIYVSSVSNRMNEVMKVLTVFASIFIPLTFLTGIYGMNFEYMPELHWKWAYPLLWCAFALIPGVLLIYFKRKKWL